MLVAYVATPLCVPPTALRAGLPLAVVECQNLPHFCLGSMMVEKERERICAIYRLGGLVVVRGAQVGP
jgi:hypothetical protein